MTGAGKRIIKLITAAFVSAATFSGILCVAAFADQTYAPKTTLESGPYRTHTPVTYEYDLGESYALPPGNYSEYLRSLGMLFPGDKLKIIPQEDETLYGLGKQHAAPGRAFFDFKTSDFVDVATGETFGPFMVTDSITLGNRDTIHTYVREIQVIGDNPVILSSGKVSWGGWAEIQEWDEGSNKYVVKDFWPVSSLTYIILPRYQKVEYRFRLEGQDMSSHPDGEEYYDEDLNPEVIWAEDLATEWSVSEGQKKIEGPLFHMSRPFVEGYSFDGFGVGNDTTVKTINGQRETTADGNHLDIRYFCKYHLDFGFSLDNAKHGSEEDTLVIILNYKKGSITVDANGGKIDGRDSWIFNKQGFYIDEISQPVWEGHVLEGWYEDKECTKPISNAGTGVYSAVNTYINKNFDNGNYAVRVYAGWGNSDATDITQGTLSVTGLDNSQVYNGSPITQENLTVTLDGNELVKGRDYDVLYSNNIDAGTATVFIRGTGDYRGLYKKTFTIRRKTLTPVIDVDTAGLVYRDPAPPFTVSCEENVAITEADWTGRTSYTDDCRLRIYVSFSGNYTGYKYFYFDVEPLEVTPEVTLEKYEYDCTGEEIKPEVTVMVNDVGMYSYEGYTVEYKNNINPGTATVTVNMNNCYKGSASVNFKINGELPATPTPTKKPTPKPAVTIALDKKEASVVCGKTLTLKATVKGTSDKVTWKTSDSKIATVDKNGKITAKMAGVVTVTATVAGKSASCKLTVLYKDVTNPKDFWYTPTYYLTQTGVAKGYANQTEFRPANECSRAQMVTFLYRLQGEPKTKATSCKFPDVEPDDYFYKPVIWAVEKGITTGYSDGQFKPQNICTRAQTVTFLWRMAGKPAPSTTVNNFFDVKEKDYFYKATIWASEMKIVAGYSDGSFKPQGNCLRRQMVTFLYKYDKYVNKKG